MCVMEHSISVRMVPISSIPQQSLVGSKRDTMKYWFRLTCWEPRNKCIVVKGFIVFCKKTRATSAAADIWCMTCGVSTVFPDSEKIIRCLNPGGTAVGTAHWTCWSNASKNITAVGWYNCIISDHLNVFSPSRRLVHKLCGCEWDSDNECCALYYICIDFDSRQQGRKDFNSKYSRSELGVSHTWMWRKHCFMDQFWAWLCRYIKAYRESRQRIVSWCCMEVTSYNKHQW